MTLEESNAIMSKDQLVVVWWEMQERPEVLSDIHTIKTDTIPVVCKGEVGKGKDWVSLLSQELVNEWRTLRRDAEYAGGILR